MTEAEWNACADPTPMLEFLRGKAGDRKLRLFACAACRTVWPLISEVFREAIRAAERHADGLITDAALGAAVSAAHRVRRKKNGLDRAAYDAARSGDHAWGVVQNVARAAAGAAAPTAGGRTYDGRVIEEAPSAAARQAWDAAFASHLRLASSLLRDIIGPLPFRPINFQSGLLDWNDGTIPKLAQIIYGERAFDRLPLLADALEDAGCDDAEILGHCRAGGEHVRGCWVVDLLLNTLPEKS